MRTMHVDIVGKAVVRPEIAHAWTTSDRASVKFDGMKIEERFKMLNKAFGLKAIIVRPGLDGWNAISYTMTLEQMLESIGEPVKNWRRK